MNLWFKIASIISILLLLTIGFGIGYLYADKGCQEKPFIYGIKQMNDINNLDLYCECNDREGLTPFYFDKNGIRDNINLFN